MCLAVYIASDYELPAVAFDQARPAFHVQEAVFCPVNPVLQHVSKPFIYLAGSHAGCGCGFLFDGFWNDDGEYEATDSAEQIATRRALADYLAVALQYQTTIDVFTCCSGDESYPPASRRTARPADFLHDHTLFRFGELVVVSEQQAG